MKFEVFKPAMQSGKPVFDTTIDLISTDPHVVQQYINSIYLRGMVEGTMRYAVEQQKKRAIALISLLKKEYKLE